MSTTYIMAIEKVTKWLFKLSMVLKPIDYEPIKEHALITLACVYDIDTNTIMRDIHANILTLRKSELH